MDVCAGEQMGCPGDVSYVRLSRCEARAITTHRDRKYVQGSGWRRKIERGMHVELGRLMGCGGTHV